MVTEVVRKEYEAHVKECVREGRTPLDPETFVRGLELPSDVEPPTGPVKVAWARSAADELTFAKFQDLLLRSGTEVHGINVVLKWRFESGALR